MFERFTTLVRSSLVEANIEATAQQSGCVDTEHVLLGLLRVGRGVAYEVLQALGVDRAAVLEAVSVLGHDAFDADALASIGIDLDAVRRAVDQSFGPGAFERAVTGEPWRGAGVPLTEQAKRVLERSLQEALALGHNYIGTEHVLLGILGQSDYAAAEALRRVVPEADIRHCVMERLRRAS